MFIDYIYLLLIIILICFIIFLIYLSYEYRNIGISDTSETSESTEIREDFIIRTPVVTQRFRTAPTAPISPAAAILKLPPMKKMSKIKFDLYNYNKLANKFDKSYVNINTEINNRDVTTDNIKNIKLFDKITKNLLNSQKLINLKKNVDNLIVPEKYPIDKLIKTIKSKYNSQYISTLGFDKSKYAIMANDKCLTVNGLCKEPFCLLECQKGLYSSDSQKFKTERITNEVEAAKAMNTTLNKIASTNIYPFNLFKSVVNNNCLTLSTDGITVEDCNVNNIKQQWEISPDENICVLK
jgi:hypothetical protein